MSQRQEKGLHDLYEQVDPGVFGVPGTLTLVVGAFGKARQDSAKSTGLGALKPGS